VIGVSSGWPTIELIFDFGFWIEERHHVISFFNPKSKIQNRFSLV